MVFLGINADGKKVFLKEIWPSRAEIHEVEKSHVLPAMFKDVYARIELGSKSWQTIVVDSNSELYPWDPQSTYIKKPPFFETMTKVRIKNTNIVVTSRVNFDCVLGFVGASDTQTDTKRPSAAVLGRFGDDGSYQSGWHDRKKQSGREILRRARVRWRRDCCKWCETSVYSFTICRLTPKDFNSYGSRRGNDEVMARGTFANIRLVNKFMSQPGPRTIHIPSKQEVSSSLCTL